MIISNINRIILGRNIKDIKNSLPIINIEAVQPYKLDISGPDFAGLNDIPGHLILILLLHEDQNFFIHAGFNWKEIKNRTIAYLSGTGPRASGSSITQQLVRRIYNLGFSSLLRKAKETLLTIEMEETFTKEQILELYLNSVILGYPKILGFKDAAYRYFKKDIHSLTIDECVCLVQLIESPVTSQKRYLSPTGIYQYNYKRAYEKYLDFFTFYFKNFNICRVDEIFNINNEMLITKLKYTAIKNHSPTLSAKSYIYLQNKALLQVKSLQSLLKDLPEKDLKHNKQ